MTGMGNEMKNADAPTIAQDESTCVVFGIPKEAIKLCAAETIMKLPDIPGKILALFSR